MELAPVQVHWGISGDDPWSSGGNDATQTKADNMKLTQKFVRTTDKKHSIVYTPAEHSNAFAQSLYFMKSALGLVPPAHLTITITDEDEAKHDH